MIDDVLPVDEGEVMSTTEPLVMESLCNIAVNAACNATRLVGSVKSRFRSNISGDACNRR